MIEKEEEEAANPIERNNYVRKKNGWVERGRQDPRRKHGMTQIDQQEEEEEEKYENRLLDRETMWEEEWKSGTGGRRGRGKSRRSKREKWEDRVLAVSVQDAVRVVMCMSRPRLLSSLRLVTL